MVSANDGPAIAFDLNMRCTTITIPTAHVCLNHGAQCAIICAFDFTDHYHSSDVSQNAGVKALDVVPLTTGVGIGASLEVTFVDRPEVVVLLVQESVGITDGLDDLAIFHTA